MTDNTVVGEKMLYSWNPSIYNKRAARWSRVDKDGYRNKSTVTNQTDVVILGDSVLFGANVKEDLATKFNKNGISAYNLAMGGYGPFHYLDAYQEFVVSRKVSHKVVLLFLSLGNDFLDATRYIDTINGGGDYRSYLGKGQSLTVNWLDRLPLYMPALILRSPKYLKMNLSLLRQYMSDQLGQSGVVEVSYASYEVAGTNLELFNPKPGSAEWLNTLTALNRIVGLTTQAEANLLIVLMPNSGLIYHKYIKGLREQKGHMINIYKQISSNLSKEYSKNRNVRVLDAIPILSDKIGKQRITSIPWDYHLNENGMGSLFLFVCDHLKFKRKRGCS